MAWTQADLDNLDAAIASGARDVSVQGKRVTYNTTDSMLQVRDIIRDSLRAGGKAETPLGFSSGI